MEQLHAGNKSNNNDIYPMNKLWHTNSNGLYWCGDLHSRTPLELLQECKSTIADLIINHSELINCSEAKHEKET
jgi:hypothetical protein